MSRFQFTDSIIYNITMITAGAFLFALGVKAIASHHQFIVGGLFGTALLIKYATNTLNPGVWFFILNIPIFLLARFFVSGRFFWLSLYAMIISSLAYELVNVDFGITNQLYAAIAAGVICGAGSGLILRTFGSGGGLDVIAIILFQRYNIGVGRFYLIFNAVLFIFGSLKLGPDLLIASLIMVFTSSDVMDKVMTLYSQRKMAFIISPHVEQICTRIQSQLKQGSTYLMGEGAYNRTPTKVLMTVTNNIQLKKLEEIVFTTDERALFIVENTQNVIGSSFSKRKLY
ncbi:YitT family protein [Desulfovibrio inopinatus]|uniref:YitT family protein n=1 Tax=Desulfovibrio inopinatus TaxID=102109 RepID=UPI000419EC5D|nr:YitT family protein [Desulfovibrio inopinatus]